MPTIRSFERPDGSQRKLSGYVKTTKKFSGKKFGASRVSAARLPPQVDLREKMTTVEQQGGTSSCVANAVAGAYEYLVKQHRDDDAYDVSRLFIYFNARAVGGDVDPREGPALEDEGSMIGAAIEGLKRYGACSEATWPFEEDSVNEAPSDEAFDEASAFLVEEVEQVPTNLIAWKSALAEGNPIIFGINLFESFDAQRRPGMVPSPSPEEVAREEHGGHAMLCVGYSDRDNVFIVRNSWGDAWGDNGYCYMPYTYLMNPRFNDGDTWIIKRVEAPEIDESTWGDGEESVLEDVDNELAAMSDEDYAAMRDAMGNHPFETRLALIFLTAAAADGDVSEEEIEGIAEVLGRVHEALNITLDPYKVLKRAVKLLGNESLTESTIRKFAEHVPARVLASLVNELQNVVDVDTEEEEDFIAALTEAWQVDASGENDGEEDGDDEEEGDDDLRN